MTFNKILIFILLSFFLLLFSSQQEIDRLKKTPTIPVAVQTGSEFFQTAPSVSLPGFPASPFTFGPQTTLQTMPSAPPKAATEIHIMDSDCSPIRDEIDSRLDALEQEEMEISRQQASTSRTQPQQLSQLQQLFALERKEREKSTKAPKPQPTEEIIIEDEILEPLGPRYVEPQFQTIPKEIPVVASAPPAHEDYYVVLPCIFCNKSIQCKQHNDGSGQMREMIDHLEKEHNQKMCPICSTLFDMNLPVYKSYFHNHVNDHLKNAQYPELER